VACGPHRDEAALLQLFCAECSARQLVQAFPEETAPRHLVRDRDQIYGGRFRRMLEILGVEEVVTAARSPWQNAYAERLRYTSGKSRSMSAEARHFPWMSSASVRVTPPPSARYMTKFRAPTFGIA
jgi:transposase InsO family protein